jgi:transposase-like protein
MLSDRRNTNAAYRFLRKVIKTVSHYPPSSITPDKLASYPKAIVRLKNEGPLPKDVEHRTSKYLTDVFDKPFWPIVLFFSGTGDHVAKSGCRDASPSRRLR